MTALGIIQNLQESLGHVLNNMSRVGFTEAIRTKTVQNMSTAMRPSRKLRLIVMNPQVVLLLLLVAVPCTSAGTCRGDQFACANQQQCIHAFQRCNGITDCRDGSDEQCTGRKCANYEFTCANGKCLSKRIRCNGRDDCGDGSDEQQCLTCRGNQMACANQKKCIYAYQRCNGITDCSDGSDEQCITCRAGEIACANQVECIFAFQRCDKTPDCRDGSDEQCRKCASYEFTCANGKCLSKWGRCFYGHDCGDGSDAQQCRKFVITVTVVQIQQSPFLWPDG